jgi:hypothetical protein
MQGPDVATDSTIQELAVLVIVCSVKITHRTWICGEGGR